jgi:hypothetical protein
VDVSFISLSVFIIYLHPNIDTFNCDSSLVTTTFQPTDPNANGTFFVSISKAHILGGVTSEDQFGSDVRGAWSFSYGQQASDCCTV